MNVTLSPSPINRVDIENVNSFLHDPCSLDENELKILTLGIWMTNDVLNQACRITKSEVKIVMPKSSDDVLLVSTTCYYALPLIPKWPKSFYKTFTKIGNEMKNP